MGYILRRHPVWWANYNYLLAMALACGVAFQGLVMAFAFNMPRVDFPYVESFFLFFVCLLSPSREKERKREVSPTLLTADFYLRDRNWWGNHPDYPDRCFPPTDKLPAAMQV